MHQIRHTPRRLADLAPGPDLEDAEAGELGEDAFRGGGLERECAEIQRGDGGTGVVVEGGDEVTGVGEGAESGKGAESRLGGCAGHESGKTETPDDGGVESGEETRFGRVVVRGADVGLNVEEPE